MNRQTAVRVLREGDVHPNRAEVLATSLLQAAREARQFAKSLEIKDDGQRLRYRSLADTLTAQANSLRSEVSQCGSRLTHTSGTRTSSTTAIVPSPQQVRWMRR